MSFVPKPHEIYKHFKGNLYQVTAIAEHTETGEQLVVYQALYGDFKTYARPLAMFVSPVDRRKYPDAAQEFRFELQGPEAERQRQESQPAQGSPSAQEPQPVQEPQPAQEPQPVQEPQPAQEHPDLDPQVLAFLDADTYAERLNILTGLHSRITDEMITTMAFACDVEVEEGDLESRYLSLRQCLRTQERFECTRLRE